MPALRPLLLTGGPAVGKTVTARALAESTARCAYIDVDDVRQLVQTGCAAPWDGEEGRAQHLLGVRNAAALAANFSAGGFNVTMSDVIDAELLHLYRELVPGVMVIRLSITRAMAHARAQSRRVYLTDQEFRNLAPPATRSARHRHRHRGVGIGAGSADRRRPRSAAAQLSQPSTQTAPPSPRGTTERPA